MTTELTPAISLLERELEDVERNAAQLRSTINFLRAKAGLSLLPETGPSPTGVSGHITQIGPDTFYGKKLQTAVREYLEMRKAQGLGPARPREIYDAITAGGFQFEASSAEVALVGLRALLRKRTNFFHKLPNGTYGLTVWYPHAKTPKSASKATVATDDDDEDDMEAAASAEGPDDAAAA